jgi:site-specific recombinase XerD
VLAATGPNGLAAAAEFFQATLNNPHTQRAYGRAVREFLLWCAEHRLDLRQVSPGLAGQYLAAVPRSAATRNQMLAALRSFAHGLVLRHVLALNPFSSVRGVKFQVVEGRTAEISLEQARQLLHSLPAEAVRDRAILGVLGYTGARVGAVCRLQAGDYRDLGGHRALRFLEKGGKQREIPVHRSLERWLEAYLDSSGLRGAAKSARLFCIQPHTVRQMLKRRLRKAGLPALFSPHSFRVAVVTDLLRQNVPLEDVQYLVGHADPRTTQLYDRRQRQVTRGIVDRISL